MRLKLNTLFFYSAVALISINCFLYSPPLHGQTSDSPLSSLRCGSNIVSLGDRIYEVREFCGAPDYTDRWLEERIVRDFSNPWAKRRRKFDRARQPFLTKKYVTVEEWTYRGGNTRFTRYLIFENSILQEIYIGN